MSQFETGTFLAFLAFFIFFLVAYKLQQISLFTLILLLVATTVGIVVFYVLSMQFWFGHA
ncbi:hypothetical protein ACAF76_004300 [Brevibacillus sp. TJ4]|uniref:hypothetical protein n=1 Tax=Brevibacillus sp. TJ4 TaxID=3234853 RepID=UPI0037D82F41